MAANNPIEIKTKTFPNGYRISYRNDCELEVIYNDVFTHNTYFFRTDDPEPRIVDCGGHIGLAVLYFKSLYPGSRIVTFEPNPETFALLKKNIAQNNLRGVEAVNMALSCEDDDDAVLYVGKDFLEAWDSTDTIKPDLWVDMTQYRSISARSARLSSYIANGVDFIKLDIEGAEYDVLCESRDKIGSVSAITLEYHQNARNLAERTLEKTLEILSDAGFGCELFYQSRPVTLHSLPNDAIYQLIIKATK
ncbi:MAG: FkbM family methyltransferase [Terrimicrobiaceae bacterium]